MKRSTPEIPVPTAASVIARSGVASIIHNTDRITPYDAKMITAESRRFIAQTATAAISKKLNKIISISIIAYNLTFVHDIRIGSNFQMGDQMAGDRIGEPKEDKYQEKFQ